MWRRGIWSRARHVQNHVENVCRLNRPWSLNSERFAGIAGHVITSTYDKCAVKMRIIKCMCIQMTAYCYFICVLTTRLNFDSFVLLDSFFPLSEAPLILLVFHPFCCYMDVCRVENRQRNRRPADRKKKHLAILKSHHSGEEGIKAPECSLGPSGNKMTCLRARLFTSCCYNILQCV